MSTITNASYFASPGVEIKDWLEENSRTQEWLADKLGKSRKTINSMLNGKSRIDANTALALEDIVGMSASYWAKRDAVYHVEVARAIRDGIAVDNEQGDREIPKAPASNITINKTVDFVEPTPFTSTAPSSEAPAAKRDLDTDKKWSVAA